MLNHFRNIQHLLKTFPDEQSCIDFLYSLDSGCPRCNHNKTWRFKDGKRFKCAKCRKQFTMKTGTIFENSNISLKQWFIIIYLNTKTKKGLSSYTIAEEAEITQKTCWYRLQSIRWALGKDQPEQMAGIVEADETYVGGKNKNRHKPKRVEKNEDKTIVFGMLSRSSGKVRATVVNSREQEDLEKEIISTVHKTATIITDDHNGYNRLSTEYKHIELNRSAYQYARYGILTKNEVAHTNGIEGFWPFIDRSVYGTYHKISSKHLQLYTNECTFRYNTRSLSQSERMMLALKYRYGKISHKNIRERQSPQRQRPFNYRP